MFKLTKMALSCIYFTLYLHVLYTTDVKDTKLTFSVSLWYPEQFQQLFIESLYAFLYIVSSLWNGMLAYILLAYIIYKIYIVLYMTPNHIVHGEFKHYLLFHSASPSISSEIL